MDSARARVVDIVRAALGDFSPDPQSDFDFLADAYSRNPGAARRAVRQREEPTGSGWDSAVQVVQIVFCAVGVELAKDLVLFSARKAGRKPMAFLRRRRRRDVTLDTVAPPMPPELAAELHASAVEVAVARKVPRDKAEEIATALVARWPRQG